MYLDPFSVPHSLSSIESQRAVWLAGPTCVRHEVIGEAYNPEQMGRVVAAVQGRTDALLPAWILPEAHSNNSPAAAVWVLGGKVGYLPQELVIRWAPIFSSLFERYGANVACQAQIEPPSQANLGSFGVVLWLPALPAVDASVQTIGGSAHVPAAPSQQTEVAFSQPSAEELPKLRGEVARAKTDLEAARIDAERLRSELAVASAGMASQPSPDQLAKLREEIAWARTDLERARKELESVEEALEIQSFGFYQPRYGFESSAQYVARLKAVRDEQRELIKGNKAAPCDTTWKVGGSAAEGKKMVRQQAKLMLRAFNGECDAAIANVSYDNVTKLEERIRKAYDTINKLGEVQRVFIAQTYYSLKIAELHLVHEHRERIQEEREEQQRIKAQMREEQRVQEEIERARADAERQEQLKEAELTRAQRELAMSAATDQQHAKLESLVTRLETELKEALDRKAKAIARAQLTRSGHVYVLSNIGSFGDGVYKIGMTRRLEPLERVFELGDASVPFPFDVHAMIYSEDAPNLESQLHQEFASRRVNLANHRKEYFRVGLDEIRNAVEKLHATVTFVLVPVAEEYRKTQAATVAEVK
jgi:hypothetical protein